MKGCLQKVCVCDALQQTWQLNEMSERLGSDERCPISVFFSLLASWPLLSVCSACLCCSLPYFLDISMFCLSFRTSWLWTEFTNTHFRLQQNVINSQWYATNVEFQLCQVCGCRLYAFFRANSLRCTSYNLCCWLGEVMINVLLPVNGFNKKNNGRKK